MQLRKELALGGDSVGGGHGIWADGVGQKKLASHPTGAVLFSAQRWPGGQTRTVAGSGQ